MGYKARHKDRQTQSQTEAQQRRIKRAATSNVPNRPCDRTAERTVLIVAGDYVRVTTRTVDASPAPVDNPLPRYHETLGRGERIFGRWHGPEYHPMPASQPTAPLQRATVTHEWTITVRAWPVSVPDTNPDGSAKINPKTGEQAKRFIGIRRATFVETSGAEASGPNRYRILATDRKASPTLDRYGQRIPLIGEDGERVLDYDGRPAWVRGPKVTSLTLASWDGMSVDEQGNELWVRDRALSHDEAVQWLDGRTDGKGRVWLETMLTAMPERG